MSNESFYSNLQTELKNIEEAGLYKRERIIISPQGADIKVKGGQEVINFCANNYLGLSSHPDVIAAAKRVLDTHGYGMSSVRFICGTQDIHKTLEEKISKLFTNGRYYSYMLPALMRMAGFLNLCLANRMPLFPMN